MADTKWLTHIKHSFRSCMVGDGNKETPLDSFRWPLVSKFTVLGHALQSNGSVRACWSKARAAMWKSFWAILSLTVLGYWVSRTGLHYSAELFYPSSLSGLRVGLPSPGGF